MRAAATIAAIAAVASLASAQQREAVVRSAHVELRYPSRERPERIVREIERAYDHVRAWGLDLPARVQARVYSSTADFVARSRGSRYNLAVWSGGLLHLQPIGLLERRSDVGRGLKHELVHVALDPALTRGVPRWIAEGLAMNVAGEMQPTGRAPGGADQLDRDLGPGSSYERARNAYGWSQRLVAALLDGYGRDAAVAMLRQVGGGTAFETAFRSLTGSDSRSWVQRRLRSS